MHTLLSIVFFACLLSSCSHLLTINKDYDNSPNTLYQSYSASSDSNSKSRFNQIRRNVEFEYVDLVTDSIAKVVVMLTSGLNEGSLEDKFFIQLNNGTELALEFDSKSSNDYLETYSYNTTMPVTKTQTVNDPGGIDLQVQADGTHKQVIRPASTKTVQVTENQTTAHSGSKTQLFNKGRLFLLADHIQQIKTHGITKFTVYLEDAILDIFLTGSDNNQIKKRL